MHATTATLTLVLVLAGTAFAQSTTSTSMDPSETSETPRCVVDCIMTAVAGASCSDITDLDCVCASTVHDAAIRCIQNACPELVGVGENTHSRVCDIRSITPSSTATATASTSGSPSSSSSVSASTSSRSASSTTSTASSIPPSTASPTTSGAKELVIGKGGMWAAGAAVAGAVVGGWIV